MNDRRLTTRLIVLVSTAYLLGTHGVARAQAMLTDNIDDPASLGGTSSRPAPMPASDARPHRKLAVVSLAQQPPAVAATVAKAPSKERPLTWSELNRGFFLHGALVGHIGASAALSGIGTQVDCGYQFGFGLGIVGHTEYTRLLPVIEGATGFYVNVGGGLRFAAPVTSWLRFGVQGTYGISTYLFEADTTGEAVAWSGVGTSLALRAAIDIHVTGSRRGGHVFVGVAAGVDYSRFDDGQGGKSTDLAKKVAISVTYVL